MRALDHWVVAGRRCSLTEHHRYSRLAAYLHGREETRHLYWVCFRRRQGSPLKVTEIQDGVFELVLSDPIDLLRYLPSLPIPRALRGRIHAAAADQILWFTLPSCPSLASVGRWSSIVYDCYDRWAAPWDDRMRARSPETWVAEARRRAMIRAEREIVRQSSAVVATVSELSAHLREAYGRSADALVENGVDFLAFASATRRPVEPRQLIYTGGIKPSIDFELLDTLSRTLGDAEILLAGPVSGRSRADLDQLLRRPNVRHVDSVEPDSVPELLSFASVGLMPYRSTEWTAAASPYKLFEYLAAGLPVVGSGVPATREHQADGMYVHAEHRAQFIDACTAFLETEAARSEAEIEARRKLAAPHDWALKFDALLQVALSGRSRPGDAQTPG